MSLSFLLLFYPSSNIVGYRRVVSSSVLEKSPPIFRFFFRITERFATPLVLKRGSLLLLFFGVKNTVDVSIDTTLATILSSNTYIIYNILFNTDTAAVGRESSRSSTIT